MPDPQDPHPKPPQLSADYVRKIARLSRLAITDDEVADYQVKLSAAIEDNNLTITVLEGPAFVRAKDQGFPFAAIMKGSFESRKAAGRRIPALSCPPSRWLFDSFICRSLFDASRVIADGLGFRHSWSEGSYVQAAGDPDDSTDHADGKTRRPEKDGQCQSVTLSEASNAESGDHAGFADTPTGDRYRYRRYEQYGRDKEQNLQETDWRSDRLYAAPCCRDSD